MLFQNALALFGHHVRAWLGLGALCDVLHVVDGTSFVFVFGLHERKLFNLRLQHNDPLYLLWRGCALPYLVTKITATHSTFFTVTPSFKNASLKECSLPPLAFDNFFQPPSFGK